MEIVQLIARCRQGDKYALGELYKTYAKRMSGVCRRYISDKETINDVLHDSFVIIFTSFDKLRDDSKADAWIMSITRNVALKYTEFQKNHQTASLKDAGRKDITLEDFLPKDEKELSYDEIMSFINKLPEGYGKVFRLAVFEGLSHKEIGAMLNIEPHSSSSQLARAKKLLRKMIREYWAVLLLFLIPLSFLLLRKENSVSNEENPIVEQTETPTIQPTEELLESTVVPRPTQKTTIIADTQPSADDYIGKPAISDTMTTVVAQEVTAPDSLHGNSRHDTIHTIQKNEMPYYDLADIFPEKPVSHSNKQKWSIGVAYAGSLDEQNVNSSIVSQIIHGGSGFSPIGGDDEKDYDTTLYTNHHYMPVSLTLAAHYKLNKRIGVETGVSYIRLVSDFEKETDSTLSREPLQTIHYIGIPVKGICNIFTIKAWSLYGKLGLTMAVPIHSQFNNRGLVHGATENIDTTNIHVPLQWSLSTGFGLQYAITPKLGVFTEPSVRYYLPTNSGLETYCTEHPFSFSLPVGIKFIW